MSRLTRANQRGWDALAHTHYKTYHINRLLRGEPLLNDLIRAEVGDVRGKSLIHLLCHIGTDTLSWALLGAQVTGVDISPVSVGYARELAGKMGIQADFIESDIMDAADQVKSRFDIAFSSTGVLCWIPDIRVYARTVRGVLKEDGFFYLFDGHPFRKILQDESGSFSGVAQGDYFRKEPWRYEDMGDYTDPGFKFPGKSYEWDWTMGEVVSAFCEVGMRIIFLHEFPQYFYHGYTPYDVEEEKKELYPCTFSLKASVM